MYSIRKKSVKPSHPFFGKSQCCLWFSLPLLPAGKQGSFPGPFPAVHFVWKLPFCLFEFKNIKEQKGNPACKHATVSSEAVLCTTLSPSVCSVTQVNKIIMSLDSTREEKHLFHLQMLLHKPHIHIHIRNVNSAAEKPLRYSCTVILERSSNKKKLNALFLMQDPGKKLNMLLLKNKTKKTPKAQTLSWKYCLDAKS